MPTQTHGDAGVSAPERTATNIRDASDFLLALRREGRYAEAIPAPLRPQTRAEGYAVQRLSEGWSAGPPWGWKIAATSLAGQKHINVDGPLAGLLLAEDIALEGAPLSLGSNRMRVAEVEFVFRMKRALEPRQAPFTADEVMAAVGSLHLGMEIPDSRFLDFTIAGAPQLIADSACASQFVLGPEIALGWRDHDLAGHFVQGRAASGAVHEGKGANVLGDPRIAMTWLVNELSLHGFTLRENQFVTTGTCVAPVPIAPGEVVTADYGAFGTMQVRFIA